MYRGVNIVGRYRRYVILLGLAFVAAAAHVFLGSPVHHETSTTPSSTTGTAGLHSLVGQSQQSKSVTRRLWHSKPRDRFAAREDLGEYIHSTAFFQDSLHEPQDPPMEACSCPAPADADTETAALQHLSQLHMPQLPMPTRIQPLPPSSTPQPDLFAHFAEVYAINLPTRTDRRHYVCSVLQRLNVSALLWPAFSKYSTAVRTYAVQRRTANPDPIFINDPIFLPDPPPVPPEAAAEFPPLYKSHPPRKPTFLRSQIACFVSHREVWLDIVAKRFQRPVLILEDDIDPDLNFVESVAAALRHVPDDWAVLWVGHCFEEMQDHTDAKVGHRLYRARSPACTHAYALRNASIAAHFVDAIGHDVNRPVDLSMITLLKARGAALPGYVMMPPPVSQLWRTDKRKYVQANTNPSDVVALAMKLPMQRILHPVREVMLREAAAAEGLPAAAIDGPEGEGLLCGNSLFHLAPPDDAPDELAHYPPADFLP
eukprot:jgi/Ulvmu1/753/UM010_0127.1